MLVVARLRPGGAAYYAADLAGEDPGQRAEWVGRGAARAGLRGRPGPDDVVALLDRRHPGTGRAWPVRAGPVSGLDLTFAAPKSVSLLWALGPPGAEEACRVAHRRAVGAGLDYLESRALGVRRGSGDDRVLRAAGGLTGVAVLHGTSRALDPHLHSHVVVANAVQDEDGRWGAVDGRAVYAHAAAAGAVYGAHLRHELRAGLGVRWRAGPGMAVDVDGVDPVLVAAFSGRRAEILEARGRRSSPAASRVAWAATRAAKSAVGGPARRALWAARAHAAGVEPAELAQVVGREPDGPDRLDEHRFAGLVAAAGDGVPRRAVVAAFGAAAVAGCDAGAVGAAVDRVVPAAARGLGEARHAPRLVLPSPYLLGALGPRPLRADDHRRWWDAADAIDAYRRRWGVTDRSRALGPGDDAGERAGFGARRLAQRLTTQRAVTELERRLRAGPEARHVSLTLER